MQSRRGAGRIESQRAEVPDEPLVELERGVLRDKLNIGRIGWASHGADQCELIQRPAMDRIGED
jgi:hypothetical protein